MPFHLQCIYLQNLLSLKDLRQLQRLQQTPLLSSIQLQRMLNPVLVVSSLMSWTTPATWSTATTPGRWLWSGTTRGMEGWLYLKLLDREEFKIVFDEIFQQCFYCQAYRIKHFQNQFPMMPGYLSQLTSHNNFHVELCR